MAEQAGEPVPWRLFARALGYGAGCGALLGIASLAPLVVLQVARPSGLIIVELYCACAAMVGGFVGSVVGLLGGAALVIADGDKPGNEQRARSLGGTAGAAPFVGCLVLGLATDPGSGSEQWTLGSWLFVIWFFVVAVMSVVTGTVVGPRVARGRQGLGRPGFDDHRGRVSLRCSALG